MKLAMLVEARAMKPQEVPRQMTPPLALENFDTDLELAREARCSEFMQKSSIDRAFEVFQHSPLVCQTPVNHVASLVPPLDIKRPYLALNEPDAALEAFMKPLLSDRTQADPLFPSQSNQLSAACFDSVRHLLQATNLNYLRIKPLEPGPSMPLRTASLPTNGNDFEDGLLTETTLAFSKHLGGYRAMPEQQRRPLAEPETVLKEMEESELSEILHRYFPTHIPTPTHLVHPEAMAKGRKRRRQSADGGQSAAAPGDASQALQLAVETSTVPELNGSTSFIIQAPENPMVTKCVASISHLVSVVNEEDNSVEMSQECVAAVSDAKKWLDKCVDGGLYDHVISGVQAEGEDCLERLLNYLEPVLKDHECVHSVWNPSNDLGEDDDPASVFKDDLRKSKASADASLLILLLWICIRKGDSKSGKHAFSLSLSPFFVELSPFAKDIGIQKLQRSCIKLVSSVFSKYPGHRPLIMEEIVANIVKANPATASKNTSHRSNIKLRDGRNMQMITSLILQLIQSCPLNAAFSDGMHDLEAALAELGDLEDPNFDKAKRKQREEAFFDAIARVSNLAKSNLEGANTCAAYVIKYLLGRSFPSADMKTEKKGRGKSHVGDIEADYKLTLESFVRDCLQFVAEVEWPGALIVVTAFCQMMRSVLEAPKSETALKLFALEWFGDCVAKIQKLGKESRETLAADTALTGSFDDLKMVFSLSDTNAGVNGELVKPSYEVEELLFETLQKLDLKEYPIQDAGPSVRKRTIKLLKDMYLHEFKHLLSSPLESQAARIEKLGIYCQKILGRTLDQEDSVKDLSLRCLVETWFKALRSSRSFDADIETDASGEVYLREGVFASLGSDDKQDIILRVRIILKCMEIADGPLLLADALKSMTGGKVPKIGKKDAKVFLSLLAECVIEHILLQDESNDRESLRLSLQLLEVLSKSCPNSISTCIKMLQNQMKFVAPATPSVNTPVTTRSGSAPPTPVTPSGKDVQEAMRLEDMIVCSSASVIRNAVPFLKDPDLQLLNSMENDLISMLSNRSHVVVAAAIPCLCAIVQNLTKSYHKIVRVLKTCSDALSKIKSQLPRLADMSTAMLKQLARCLVISSNLLKYFNFDSFRHEFTGNAETEANGLAPKGQSLTEVVFELTLTFASPKLSPQLVSYALQALGHIFSTYPRVMLRNDARLLMDRVFQRGTLQQKCDLIHVFEEFLVTESSKSVEKDEAKESNRTIDIHILVGNADEMGDAGVSSQLMQRYLDRIIECMFESDVELSGSAFGVIALILELGLVHPLNCMPAVVAMQVNADLSIRERACHIYESLVGKHDSFIHTRNAECVKTMYDYLAARDKQLDLFEGGEEAWVAGYVDDVVAMEDAVRTTKIAALEKFYSKIPYKRGRKGDFLLSLVRSVDLVENLKFEEQLNSVKFARFACENLAMLEYKSLEEVLHIIYAIDQLLSVAGEELYSEVLGIKEKSSAEGVDSIDLSILLDLSLRCSKGAMLVSLKLHLIALYGISESKCRKYNPTAVKQADKTRNLQRVGNASTAIRWDSLEFNPTILIREPRSMIGFFEAFQSFMDKECFVAKDFLSEDEGQDDHAAAMAESVLEETAALRSGDAVGHSSSPAKNGSKITPQRRTRKGPGAANAKRKKQRRVSDVEFLDAGEAGEGGSTRAGPKRRKSGSLTVSAKRRRSVEEEDSDSDGNIELVLLSLPRNLTVAMAFFQPADTNLRLRILRVYFRLAFLLHIILPAIALVAGRGTFALTDPKLPHLATQNMFLACVQGYALLCFRASFIRDLEAAHAWILVAFGGPMSVLLGIILLMLNAFITKTPGWGFAFSGAYFLTIGVALVGLRWPRFHRAIGGIPGGVFRFWKGLPAKLRQPAGPKVPVYWMFVVALVCVFVVGLLQPGIGLAFRWYPYDDPAILSKKEGIMMAFFLPAGIHLFRAFDDPYAPRNLLFTEMFATHAAFHAFAMMCDNISGTQGNTNIHHVVGGDVCLWWITAGVLFAWHPAFGEVTRAEGKRVEDGETGGYAGSDDGRHLRAGSEA
ncbi:Sister chromatid cohesion protein 2 [Phlyctochytrium bullatum]|nr:Sister chromatid cohesion protein 2 [Phlyctochytrium bullatum]